MSFLLAGFVAMTLTPCDVSVCKAAGEDHPYHGVFTTDNIRTVASFNECDRCVAVTTAYGRTLYVVGTMEEIVCKRWPELAECKKR